MIRPLLLLFTSILLLSSCFTSDFKNTVLTESTIYVSSETVRMVGRVLETSGTISDHGFKISNSIDFQDPITVSLSEKRDLGLFVGEFSGLVREEFYHYKAYIIVDGEMFFGAVKKFSTLKPNANSFSPEIAEIGNEITINVENITSDVEVFFGEQKARIVDVKFESSIIVRVPPVAGEYRIPIRVVSDDLEFELDTFEYVRGVWRDESLSFPVNNINIFDAVYAQSDDHFVFGLGYDQIRRIHKVLYSLDFDNWSWSRVNFLGETCRSPFIEGDIFGGGWVSDKYFGTIIPNNELHMVNANGEVDLIGSFPINILKGIATRINGDLYVYGGQKDNVLPNPNQTAYKMNGTSWEPIGEHQVAPSEDGGELDSVVYLVNRDLPNFTIGNRSFFILSGKVWEFDVDRVTFKLHDIAPFFNCNGGAYQVMNDKVYLGLCNGSGDDFYEYNPISKTWKEKSRFIFSGNGYNAGSFQYNGRLYFMINPVSASRNINGPIDMYSLSPDEI